MRLEACRTHQRAQNACLCRRTPRHHHRGSIATLKEKDADKETPLRLIPKEEVKEVLGRSPDICDTLLMRAWFEIQPSAYEADPATNEAQIRLFNRNAEVNVEFDAA
jgi:hypothetical protein